MYIVQCFFISFLGSINLSTNFKQQLNAFLKPFFKSKSKSKYDIVRQIDHYINLKDKLKSNHRIRQVC